VPRPAPDALGPCPADRLPEALDLLYQRHPEPLRGHTVAEVLREAREGTLDLSGLWAAVRRDRVAAVVLTQRLAGRAAAVWPPEARPGWGRARLAAAVLRAALERLGRDGVVLAQSLVDGHATPTAAADLERGGLPRVTELDYLTRRTHAPLRAKPGTPPLAWRSFAEAPRDAFEAVLEATYAGSRDMPELEGARALDDVLAAHEATGRFDPGRWWVGGVPGEPEAAAVLLLNVAPDRDAWEIGYLGLSPPARGRGLGRAALVHALAQARPHAPRLDLAVDLRNDPARYLYARCGFVRYDRRAVHLRVFQENLAT
jgi:ribosomal protein S18 acetylase RimI-like enzyme